MTRYVALLGVSARRDLTDAQALRGAQLFTTAQCVKCHAPDLTTGPYHPMTELRSQNIHPYTDLLLHDMGPGLADNMGENGASGSEWRTPPLWSIGLTAGSAAARPTSTTVAPAAWKRPSSGTTARRRLPRKPSAPCPAPIAQLSSVS